MEFPGPGSCFFAVREERIRATAQEQARTTTATSATTINYEKSARVRSCAIDYSTLRRLYRDLAAGAEEAARLDVARAANLQLPGPAGPGQLSPTSPPTQNPYQVTVVLFLFLVICLANTSSPLYTEV